MVLPKLRFHHRARFHLSSYPILVRGNTAQVTGGRRRPKMKVSYGRGKTGEVAVTPAHTVADAKKALSSLTRLSVHRQGLSVVREGEGATGTVLRLNNLNKTLAEYGVKPNDTLTVKDLGPQIGYKTVFVVEYLGPILIMLAYAARPAFLYGKDATSVAWDRTALWGLYLWIAHFVKRELETLFVHKFSRPTMPLFNLFKNSIYYWGFALAVGYPLCHPQYTPPASETQVRLVKHGLVGAHELHDAPTFVLMQMLVGAAIMIVSELVNLAVHLQLASMRPASGSDKRDAPEGILFSLVSCPNYTAEVMSWVGFSIMTQIGFAYAFTVVGFLQMSQWALGKHVGYLKSDPTYKKRGRKAIVPFLL